MSKNYTDTEPHAMFIDNNNTIYVADHTNNRIQVWTKYNDEPIRQLNVQVFRYTGLFVTSNGDVYFENGNRTGQIDKWPYGLDESNNVFNTSDHCNGLFIDIYNYLYCSLENTNKIVKVLLTQPYSSEVINAIGHPYANFRGIFVDRYKNIYASNYKENNIYMFPSGYQNEFPLIPHSPVAKANESLNMPTDVIVDAYGHVYIADKENHRIVRLGRKGLETIAGYFNISGSTQDKLHKPCAIRFDSQGNLYVLDEENHRIQKFILQNNSCGK